MHATFLKKLAWKVAWNFFPVSKVCRQIYENIYVQIAQQSKS